MARVPGLLLPVLGLLAACGGEGARVGELTPRIRDILSAGETPVLALATGDTVRLGRPVAAFYGARRYRPAWTGEEGLTERGRALLELLDDAPSEGLDLHRYKREGMENLIAQLRETAEQGGRVADRLAHLDLLLTESFIRYAEDLSRGALDPEESGIPWEIDRGPAPDAEFLESLLAGSEDLGAVLDSLRPAIPHYRRLREGLARYRSAAADGAWPEIPAGEPPEVGERDARMGALRSRLSREGDPVESRLVAQDSASPPDVYTDALREAVAHFQYRHGLEGDGVLDESTLEALNVSLQERILDLQVNLDRWRWLPRDMGEHFVLVNVAGFEMAVIREGETALQMNVVVGQEGWETPVFQDTMEYIVFNPYWTVPPSIEREEVLPAVRRDPSYLARNHFEVVTTSGEPVSLGAALSAASGEESPYVFRQLPGPWNALGQVKFMFPNDQNIYLHDTPADHLFSQRSRAFSHGCIRIERPLELARYLLEHATDRPPSDVERLLERRDEAHVPLDRELPVYVLYFTAWADEGGSVHFHDDVYRRDPAMEERARETMDTSSARSGTREGRSDPRS